MLNLILISLAVIMLNLPFGYWRAGVKRFSVKWFLAIHLPVPIVILLRIYGSVGFAFYTYLFLVGAFFLGQKLGGTIYNNKK